MKILAINSSARTGGESKTEIMLENLVKGMREEGAVVEVIDIHKKKIKYCIGCFTCWTKTPGQCLHKDDMSKDILPKYLDSDLVVLATPLFHYTVNACLKTFIERTLPIALPFFELRDGVTRHPLRHEPPPVVALSVAGFPEESVFGQLKSYFNYLYNDRLVAEIYRTSSELMARDKNSKRIQDIFAATEQGGRELVNSLAISEETMTRIHQPITDFESMAPLGNIFWQTCIDEGVTPKEFAEKGMMPRPDSIETFLAIMKIGFNSEKAGDIKAVMQFIFSGQVEGECYFTIEDGEFGVHMGRANNPGLTIKAPFEIWMDILTGKKDGQQMFLEKKYEFDGDINLLMKMGEFFER